MERGLRAGREGCAAVPGSAKSKEMDYIAATTCCSYRYSSRGFLGYMYYRLTEANQTKICTRRLSQSLLEGMFGYARSFSRGFGALCTTTFPSAWCAIRLLRGNKVGKRDGQSPAESAKSTGKGDSFSRIHHVKKPKTNKKQRKM